MSRTASTTRFVDLRPLLYNFDPCFGLAASVVCLPLLLPGAPSLLISIETMGGSLFRFSLSSISFLSLYSWAVNLTSSFSVLYWSRLSCWICFLRYEKNFFVPFAPTCTIPGVSFLAPTFAKLTGAYLVRWSLWYLSSLFAVTGF
jgi:hypothetical protein